MCDRLMQPQDTNKSTTVDNNKLFKKKAPLEQQGWQESTERLGLFGLTVMRFAGVSVYGRR